LSSENLSSEKSFDLNASSRWPPSRSTIAVVKARPVEYSGSMKNPAWARRQ
jgi:hypothetical protein